MDVAGGVGPRRSRRDAQASAKAAAAPAADAEGAGHRPAPAAAAAESPAAPQRRSERHARLSATLADRSGVADADAGAGQRDRRRTRSSASPSRGLATPPPTAPSSPARSSTRAASANTATSVENSPALALTPSRRRRPASRAAAMTPEASGAGVGDRASQSRRVLGKYAASECTLLCEVVLDHVRRNALAADVLERERSPAAIQWDEVAKRMLATHRLAMSARECQALWKFLAYAQTPAREDGECSDPADTNGGAELLPASDEEDIERPAREILAACQATRKPKHRPLFTSESTPSSPLPTARASDAMDPTDAADSAASGAVGAANTVAEPPVKPAAGVRLYPTYELPPGSLDERQRPFSAKQMLPLTFAAEKFLKKRTSPLSSVPPGAATAVPTSVPSAEINKAGAPIAASMTQPSAGLAQSTPSLAVSPAPAAPVAALSSAGQAPNASSVEAGKKRQSSDASEADNVPAGATSKPAKKKKTPSIKPLSTSSSSQPRTPFVPSTTPPPLPNPAKTELDFFQLVYARLTDGSGAAIPTAEELALIFRAAAPAIQEECRRLAQIDGERFNRECVRRRIWEKAMGSASRSNSPLPSPAVTGSIARSESTAVTAADGSDTSGVGPASST